MIPKIIHQIWIGPHPIPEQLIHFIQTVKNLHPEFEYKFWNNNNLPTLPDKAKIQYKRYGQIKKYAFQADVLRYFLLAEYGGLYLDVDFEVYKNISPLLNRKILIASPNDKLYHICNSVIAAVPGHEIFTNILLTLKNETYHGPIFFAEKVKEYLGLPSLKGTSAEDIINSCENNEEIRCVNADLFFLRKNNFAYHHSLHSWSPKYTRKLNDSKR